jgi:hypothetical protein
VLSHAGAGRGKQALGTASKQYLAPGKLSAAMGADAALNLDKHSYDLPARGICETVIRTTTVCLPPARALPPVHLVLGLIIFG